MKYRWSPMPDQPVLCDFIVKQVGISPLLAQCLINRGLSEPDRIRCFLEPRLKQLADPLLIPNLSKAVERLSMARDRGESVLIFGDYDVDGVTSTALMYEVLTALGFSVDHYLPHRMDDGYGLTRPALESCMADRRPGVLLAVDCGSTALDPVTWLQSQGIDVIVVDHHQVSNPAPPAYALVNPYVEGANAAFRELCSVGLAFKLAHGVLKHARNQAWPGSEFDLRTCLDLVALGTIADLVPLQGENRILVSSGLERLNQTQRPGLKALMEVAAVEPPVQGYEVGFQLAPRLNAAGRLETATQALRLILSKDLAVAESIARRLDECNRERQEIERMMAEAAIGGLKSQFRAEEHFVLVEGRPDWHVGVVGIVASRVTQEFYRPSLILGGDGEHWRGSGRSIDGFDLAAALRECNDLLVKHGGHAMAAGLSVIPDRVEALRSRLNEIARRTLTSEQLQPRLRLDGEVSMRDMTVERVRELQRLQQTGMGNPAVQLYARNVTHQRPVFRMGKDKKHAKFWFSQGGGNGAVEAIWWGAGEQPLPVGRFDVAFVPKLNEYRGQQTVQLQVLDWRPA